MHDAAGEVGDISRKVIQPLSDNGDVKRQLADLSIDKTVSALHPYKDPVL